MTNLSEIGEFGLIKRFSGLFTNNLPASVTGIGDDCAVIPLNKKEALLVTTDMLIEGSHFLLHKISPFELGYKSLAVNLSDIAAMGGTPENAFLSIGLPGSIEVEWIDDFFKGIKFLGDKTNTCLLGGDTTKSPDKLVINIAVLGKMQLNHVKKRSTAKPGDMLCITGYIGDSGGGLKIILDNLGINKDTGYLVKQHHMPVPHLQEGAWLAKQPGINAMIDLSDGIESDIRRIMESSGIGAEIDLNKLPVSTELKRTGSQNGWNIKELAFTGGEDYCLMCTIKKDKAVAIASKFQKMFNRPLYNIGSITKVTGELIIRDNDKEIDLNKHGFDHFKS